MVTKLGFIGEGETEVMVLKSFKFKSILENLGFEFIGARDAGGRGNLERNNRIVESLINSLIENGAEKILIFTDLDNDSCITSAKQRIFNFIVTQEVIIISKALEALFLADMDTLNNILKYPRSYIYPEKTSNMPFDEINFLLSQDGIKEIKSKIKMTNRFLTNGFSVENAALHINCGSAKYILRKLNEIAEE